MAKSYFSSIDIIVYVILKNDHKKFPHSNFANFDKRSEIRSKKRKMWLVRKRTVKMSTIRCRRRCRIKGGEKEEKIWENEMIYKLDIRLIFISFSIIFMFYPFDFRTIAKIMYKLDQFFINFPT